MPLHGSETGCLNGIVFDLQSRLLVAAGGALATRPGVTGMMCELIAWELPALRVRWHILKKARSRFCDVAVRPDGSGYITNDGNTFSFWDCEGRLVTNVRSEFLAGPIVFTTDGTAFVAPVGNRVAVRDASSGDATCFITVSDSQYTSARAAGFVAGKPLIVIAARVINNKGHISGQLNVADYQTGNAITVCPLDLEPNLITVDPRQRWACVAGKRRGRATLQFFDCTTWQRLAQLGVSRGEIGGLAVSPDGELIATCGDDNIVRIWRTDKFQVVAKLQQHRCDVSRAASSVAWSADDRWIAYANAGGPPPTGGVFLYQRVAELEWRLVEDVESVAAAGAPSPPPRMEHADSFTGKEHTEALQWMETYLVQHTAKQPLAELEQVQAWEREHHIKLPPDYARFVSKIGRHKFENAKGVDGLDVSVVGPEEIDDEEYRREADENSADGPEPDGLMFAVAINGDCLCFDIRSGNGEYPVYYFDHEMEEFEWFAASFAAAIRRLAVQH